MKTIFLPLLIVLSATASAQTTPAIPAPGTEWSGSLYRDFKTGNTGFIALTTIDRFEKLKADLSFLAGATSPRFGTDLSGLAGFSLTWSIYPDPKLRIYTGPALTWTMNSHLGGGWTLGAAVKF
jgi:hypothetical protein